MSGLSACAGFAKNYPHFSCELVAKKLTGLDSPLWDVGLCDPSLSEITMEPTCRIPCQLDQFVAPYEGTPPTGADFYSVTLNDISQNGFSFIAREAPSTDKLVIALDAVVPRRMIAKVLSKTKRQDGRMLVDCEFVGPLDNAVPAAC